MNNAAERAKEILLGGGYTLVLCSADEVKTDVRRGVKPLLEWADNGESLRGYSAADKVVGKAAAFLYAALGVDEVYAGVISRPALSVLERYGIPVSCGELCDLIKNRDGTGLCPMETAVMDADTPEEALCVIRRKAAELAAG